MFILGLIVGATIGAITGGCLAAGSTADDRAERAFRARIDATRPEAL